MAYNPQNESIAVYINRWINEGKTLPYSGIPTNKGGRNAGIRKSFSNVSNKCFKQNLMDAKISRQNYNEKQYLYDLKVSPQ